MILEVMVVKVVFIEKYKRLFKRKINYQAYKQQEDNTK